MSWFGLVWSGLERNILKERKIQQSNGGQGGIYTFGRQTKPKRGDLEEG